MFTFQNGERGSDKCAKDGPTVSPLYHSKFDISTDNGINSNADISKNKNKNTNKNTNKFDSTKVNNENYYSDDNKKIDFDNNGNKFDQNNLPTCLKGINMTNYIPNKKEIVSTIFGSNVCKRFTGQNFLMTKQ